MRTEAKTELVAWLDDEARDADSLDEGLRLVREALAAERRATVERIRAEIDDSPYLANTPVGALHASSVLDHVYAILDEEAAR